MPTAVQSEQPRLVAPVIARAARRRRPGFLASLAGFLWRAAVGVFMCFNLFALNYLTSVFAFGWLQRWTQMRVLKGWWKRSRLRDAISFAEFCEQLGPTAPSPAPRWFWKERQLTCPALFTPVHSLWLNLKKGLQGLFAVYCLTLVPCLLMLYSWDFGWLNSFHKGYEQWWVGIAAGWLGLFLFILALFYVPLALVHQAATGEFRAFFQLRVIRKLIQARLTACLGLAFLFGFFSIVFEAMRLFLISENFPGNDRSISAAEGLVYLRYYFLAWTVPFFLSLLVLRGAAAAIYRSAWLKALRLGRLNPADLHPTLAGWLDHLDLMPRPAPRGGPVGRAVKGTFGFSYRLVATVLLFALWFGFLTRFYTGYFFNSTDALGFLNHPLVQLPCIDYTPIHLAMGREQ
jgi:hypothetical protein